MAPTIADLRTQLNSILGGTTTTIADANALGIGTVLGAANPDGQVGIWQLDNGELWPAIATGTPPDGARMFKAGVQAIISDNADEGDGRLYLGERRQPGSAATIWTNKRSLRPIHTVTLELFYPKDVVPPPDPLLNEAEPVLALYGIPDSPVNRIFAHYQTVNLITKFGRNDNQGVKAMSVLEITEDQYLCN